MQKNIKINFVILIFKVTFYTLVIYEIYYRWYTYIDIILITLFSYLILKIQIYRHQYLSIIMMISSGIVLNYIHGEFRQINFIYVIFNILTHIIYSLTIILKRYAIEYYFCSAYEIVFYEGIFSFIIFSGLLIIFTNLEVSKDNIICPIDYNKKCYIDNFWVYISELWENKGNEISILIITIIYYIPYYLFFNLTIEHNSVFYIIFILLGEEIYFFDYSKDALIISLNIILTFIILFMFFVYIETIELNFCGLSANIKKNIIQRTQNEDIDNEKEILSETLPEYDGLILN